MSRPGEARLHLLTGPGAGTIYELGDSCTVGRSAECDLSIPEITVSRRHACIRVGERGYEIEDLGSGNGTIVNGREISRGRLNDGDEIAIGDTQFRFETNLPTTDSPVRLVGRAQASSENLESISLAEGAPEPPSDASAVRVLSARLRTMTALSEVASNVLDVDELLAEMVTRLLEAYPSAERAVAFEIGDAGEPVATTSRVRRGDPLAPVDVSRTILLDAMRARRAVLSRNAMEDTRFREGRSVASLGLCSVMAAPLVFRGEVLGLIYLDSPGIDAFQHDDLEVLSGIAAQGAIALGSAWLHESRMREQRMARDLQLAERIQLSFLPDRVPELPGFAFGAHYEPAYQVGGDFYDFIELPDGKLGVALGDVSGKGVSAALYMARLTRDLRYLSLSDPDPAQILAGLNRSVLEGRRDDVLVTLVLAILDPASSSMIVANAGHLPILVRRANGEVETIDHSVGLPLGVLDDEVYTTEHLALEPGDAALLFSDGLIEAVDTRAEMFGMHRLTSALARVKGRTAPEMVAEVAAACREHAGEAPPADDTTIVVVRAG